MERTFRRGSEKLTLEFRHEIATNEFLIVSGAPSQPRTTHRFTDQAEALAYLDFLESRLRSQQWDRIAELQPSGAPGQLLHMPSVRGGIADPSRRADRAGGDELAETDPAAGKPVESKTADDEPAGPVGDNAADSEPIDNEPVDSEPALGSYALGRPLICPHCREWIRSIRVVKLTRLQVPFTSRLPRGGRALACPTCDGILSIELSGLL